MKVRDVMTREVLTVAPEASLREAAQLLVRHGFSGLPVCGIGHRVVGVISQGDILYKEYDPARNGPLAWFLAVKDIVPVAKSLAVDVREAMTAPAITLGSYASVSEAARLMVQAAVNRLPVVDDGELVGIVTRTDLVRAFTRADEQIEQEIREEVMHRNMWLDSDAFTLQVEDGRVRLAGALDTRDEADLLERLTRRVPGVVDVQANPSWAVDGRGRPVRAGNGR